MSVKYSLLTLVMLLLFSCSKRDSEGEAPKPEEENKVTLTVNNSEEAPPPSSTPEPSSRSTAPSPSPAPAPRQPAANSFLSGKTEFLSLGRKESISARGFNLGDLYFQSDSPAEERAVASQCFLFFQSLYDSQFPGHLVGIDQKREMEDFWSYFIKDKVMIDNVILGKPLRRGKERQIPILLLPEKREAFVYLEDAGGGNWLLTGFEVDLRDKREESGEEKWAPTVSPSPFGY